MRVDDKLTQFDGILSDASFDSPLLLAVPYGIFQSRSDAGADSSLSRSAGARAAISTGESVPYVLLAF